MTMSSIDINNLSINMKKRLRTVASHSEINNARKEILKEFNIHPNSKRVHLISITAEKLYKKGEYDAAVLKISEYIEEYLILHIINTIPLKYFNQDYSGLPLGTQSYEKTLKADNDCLCGALEHLIFYYAYSQKEFEIIQFLDKIENIIDSVVWNEKIILCKMVIKGIINEDINAAKKEISNKDDIIKINDVELLTVCLDVFGDELSDSETISVIDKIIKNTDSPTIRLQYQTLLGIEYMLMGVEEKAIDEINKAINDFYITEEEKDNSYTYIIWGRAYYALGILKNSTVWYDHSIEKFNKALSIGELNTKGKAMVFRFLGDCYKFKSNYGEATTYYINSIELDNLNSTIIELLDNLIHIDEKEIEIPKWNKKIIKESLNKSEEYDYLMFCAKLALKNNDYDTAKEVLIHLKELDENVIYFENYRKEAIKELQNYCDNKNAGLKTKILNMVSHYKIKFMFEPNWNGIGFKITKD